MRVAPDRLLLLAAAALLVSSPGCRDRHSPALDRPRSELAVLRFTDVASRAGIRFRADDGSKPPLDILQTAGYGGGFLDFDGDGWLDILLVGRPRCRLYRNLRDGRFADATAAAGLNLAGHWMGCAAADYDNDGRTDLFLSGYRTAALFRNAGARFRRVPLPFPGDHWGSSAVFFDSDADGWLDLYVGCYVRFGPDAPRLCDFAGIQAACSPSHYDPQSGHLYRNLGPGRGFRDVTAAVGLHRTHGKTLGVAAVDCDGDGRQDLYLANDGMPGDLFLNRGGRFENVGLESGTAMNREGREQAGMGVDWADVNEDGRPDLLVTTFQHEPASLYLNVGRGTFREDAYSRGIGDATVRTLGFGARFFDADNDARLDLYLANGHVQDAIGRMQPGVTYSQPGQLFRGLSERFTEELGPGTADARRPIVGRAVATGDYDNDGRVDLLVTNLEGEPLLLRNETEPTGHWLSLLLRGTRSPRDGTGAVVTARVKTRAVTRYAGTGGSYLATSDPRVHLGLGDAGSVAITIRWPSGVVQDLGELPAGRLVTVREGE